MFLFLIDTSLWILTPNKLTTGFKSLNLTPSFIKHVLQLPRCASTVFLKETRDMEKEKIYYLTNNLAASWTYNSSSCCFVCFNSVNFYRPIFGKGRRMDWRREKRQKTLTTLDSTHWLPIRVFDTQEFLVKKSLPLYCWHSEVKSEEFFFPLQMSFERGRENEI